MVGEAVEERESEFHVIEAQASRLNTESGADVHYDAVVVGAGFAGLYTLHALRQVGLSVHAFEAGDDVGGTWYWNGYPGARCDVESVDYSYSFSDALQQEWTWTERFASREEILAYLRFVADRLDLRRDISLGTRVAAADYDEAANSWNVRTSRGERISARFCIMATGCLSAATVPRIEGHEEFEGHWLHTGNWPKEVVDLTGRRVGVIGTGSSGIQVIPSIADKVEHLYVFQRTPSFSVPARNAPLDPVFVQKTKTSYAERRTRNRQSAAGYVYDPNFESALEVPDDRRRQEFEFRWQKGGACFLVAYKDLLLSHDANGAAADFVREKIRRIVRDQHVAEALIPRGYPIGARRLCLDSGYYDTFNRANVTLVDLLEQPIDRIVPEGVRTTRADLSAGRPCLCHGLRCHDRAVARHRHPRTRGHVAAEEVGSGSANLPRPVRGWFSQLVRGRRTRKPFGIEQRGGLDRAACGVDRGVPAPHAGAFVDDGRSQGGERERMGRARQRARRSHTLSARPVVVLGGQHCGQATRLHALRWRREKVP